MKLISKSEWFALDSPLGEPDIEWKESSEYSIERIVRYNGEIVWFGLGTNWVKPKGEQWTVLTTDESVEPNDEGIYPESRQYFAPCEEPIYEKLYKENQHLKI